MVVVSKIPTSVVVHPLVLLGVVDHYNRVCKDTNKRAVGVLLVYAEEIPEPGASISEKFKTCFALSEAARKNHVYLVGGSIPERDGSKLYNCSPVFSPKGELLAKHRKIHLFDVDVPGGIRFFESETLSPGNCITVVRTELGNIGVAICYDIRFPELSMAMAREGACILCLPAAFNMTTGPAHWELLMRSRALDNQMYVAACGPARNESASYQAWGHSMIASPWGDIVISTEFQEDLLISEVKKELVQKTRVSIPLSKQRRSDLYELQYSLKSM
ncbi:Nitrilase homolog 2 [Galdieria sulphuraria]|nr:Nitrilase homolog 2 [Galdieria sulphuraria]